MAKFDCIADFEDLTPAEEKLIAACRAGQSCDLGEARPEKPKPENTVRATLLRALIIGGTPECRLMQDGGVTLFGAWVIEPLDLRFKSARGPTVLVNCVFMEEPLLTHAELSILNLSKSEFPGLFAVGLSVKGLVNLTEVCATKTVNFNSAKISGQFACNEAKLDGGKASAGWNPALTAQEIEVGGGMLMSGLITLGILDLHGAKVSGQLEFTKVNLDGKGDLAINGQNLTVKASLFWREIEATQVIGEIYLVGAHVGNLVDDIKSWPSEFNLIGLTYGRISTARNSVLERLTWLANGSIADGIFHPQPYTQLAKVLFAMGHDREAKKILMEQENRLSMVALQNLRVKPNGGTYLVFENPWIDAQVCGAKAWFWTIGLLAGHGYAPFRALVAMLALIGVTTFLAYQAWSTGAFAPNSDVIVTSNAWQVAMMKDCVPTPFPGCESNPALTWLNDRAQGIDWASFNALAYAADLALPVVELGQTSAWAPSKDRGVWGETLWWASWWIELLGWLFTVLGGAAITGLIQRSRE
jgi:hypothetical protein